MKAAKNDVIPENMVECLPDFVTEKSRSTECICPKCSARHKLKMLWTGRGIPRKFCPICKHYSTSINDLEPSKVTAACL